MIKRKNILAENMLRFRSKNIAAQEEAAIRRIIEQVTPEFPYKNPTQINGFFDRTRGEVPFPLTPEDAKTVIFATKLDPVVGVYGAASGLTRVIELPGTGLYLAVGTIGKVNDKVTAAVVTSKPGAILFGASATNPKASATETQSGGMVSGESVKFIAYDGNDLAKFANDIVRATGVRTNRVGSFQSMEKQIAAVLKASSNLGIADAAKLVPSSDPMSDYAKWKTATEKLLSAA